MPVEIPTTRSAIPANLAGNNDSPTKPDVTPGQTKFIRDLLASKDLMADPTFFDKVNAMDKEEYATYVAWLSDHLAAHVSKRAASAWITKLKELPYLPRDNQGPPPTGSEEWQVQDFMEFAQMGQPSKPGEEMWAVVKTVNGEDAIVPRGSYCLPAQHYRDEGNDLVFYSVWLNGENKRWSVKRYESDNLVGVPRVQQYAILERIAADPDEAARQYGLNKKRCGICHRKLTNKVSRELGIGPKCRARWGWGVEI